MKTILFILLFALTSCAHNVSVSEMKTEQRVKKADDFMAKKKYRSAQEIYGKIIFECKGDTLMKKAQYQLANCYYHQKLYEDAIFEYEELLGLFPVSEYSEEADFRIGVCWFELSRSFHLDQQETVNAIKQFELFRQKYPNSNKIQKVMELLNDCKNKLLAKKYENGYIYYILGHYNAALMYMNEIFDENITGDLDRKALILAAKIYFKKEDNTALEKIYATFRQKYPDNPDIEY